MGFSRSMRRSNPTTLVLAALLAIGFIFFIFTPGASQRPANLKIKHNSPASNPLSPPTAPFKKGTSQNKPPPVVHYALNNVTASARPAENLETVLILTPLARFYPGYWDNLLALTFPHHLISIGFIIPKNKDGNAATAALQAAVKRTQQGAESKRFASVTIIRQDFDPPFSQDEADRHRLERQRERRSALSRARNALLFTTMGPSTAWVLWLDADVVETPPTLIEDLAQHDKPVLAPTCLQRFVNGEGQADVRPYDYNSWQDSEEARELGKKMGPDDILVEGYAEMPTYRTLMAKVADTSAQRDQKKILELDGVGGAALMVKAEVHRDGAMFPPFAFYHLIETEGFAKMAKRLGWSCYGLPNYFVSRPRMILTLNSLVNCANVHGTGVPLQRVSLRIESSDAPSAACGRFLRIR